MLFISIPESKNINLRDRFPEEVSDSIFDSIIRDRISEVSEAAICPWIFNKADQNRSSSCPNQIKFRVLYRITNNGTENAKINLDWTPLDPCDSQYNHMMIIHEDSYGNKTLPHKHYWEVEPNPKKFLLLKPGQSVSRVFSLANVYDMTDLGAYFLRGFGPTPLPFPKTERETEVFTRFGYSYQRVQGNLEFRLIERSEDWPKEEEEPRKVFEEMDPIADSDLNSIPDLKFLWGEEFSIIVTPENKPCMPLQI